MKEVTTLSKEFRDTINAAKLDKKRVSQINVTVVDDKTCTITTTLVEDTGDTFPITISIVSSTIGT